MTIIRDPIPPLNEHDDRPSVKELIEKHRSAIDKVRSELVSDPLFDIKKHDDLWILRFVLSHKKNHFKATIKAAKHTLAFRKEHHLDEKDIRYTTRSTGFAKESFERYTAHCSDDAFQFLVPDENRGVIAFINMNGVDQNEMVKNVPEEDWLPCFTYYTEWAHQWQDYVTRSTGRLTKSVRFVDASELKLSGINSELMRRDGKAMGIMEDCYPQLLQSIFICHGPVWIQVPWRLFRPLFPKRVTEKFDFIHPQKNEHERHRALKHISKEHFPTKYGGLNEQWPVTFPVQN